MEKETPASSAPATGDVSPSLPYAGVAARIWAAVLDLIAIYLLFVIGLTVVVVVETGHDFFGIVASILGVSIPWLYFAGFESSAARATPGKWQARIVVTDARGERIGFVRASVRYLGKVPMAATLGLALFTIYFDRQRRALDDFIAGTRVHDVEALARGGPRPLWRKAIGPVILVVIIAFMFWIALDAQRDFQRRAKTSEAMLAGQVARAMVAEFHERTGRLPNSSAEAGSGTDSVSSSVHVSSVAIRNNGLVVIALVKSGDWPNGGEITLEPTESPTDKSLTWKCRSTLPRAALPAQCRD